MVKLMMWLNWWVAPTYVGERSRELILVGRGTVSATIIATTTAITTAVIAASL